MVTGSVHLATRRGPSGDLRSLLQTDAAEAQTEVLLRLWLRLLMMHRDGALHHSLRQLLLLLLVALLLARQCVLSDRSEERERVEQSRDGRRASEAGETWA